MLEFKRWIHYTKNIFGKIGSKFMGFIITLTCCHSWGLTDKTWRFTLALISLSQHSIFHSYPQVPGSHRESNLRLFCWKIIQSLHYRRTNQYVNTKALNFRERIKDGPLPASFAFVSVFYTLQCKIFNYKILMGRESQTTGVGSYHSALRS